MGQDSAAETAIPETDKDQNGAETDGGTDYEEDIVSESEGAKQEE